MLCSVCLPAAKKEGIATTASSFVLQIDDEIKASSTIVKQISRSIVCAVRLIVLQG